MRTNFKWLALVACCVAFPPVVGVRAEVPALLFRDCLNRSFPIRKAHKQPQGVPLDAVAEEALADCQSELLPLASLDTAGLVPALRLNAKLWLVSAGHVPLDIWAEAPAPVPVPVQHTRNPKRVRTITVRGDETKIGSQFPAFQRVANRQAPSGGQTGIRLHRVAAQGETTMDDRLELLKRIDTLEEKLDFISSLAVYAVALLVAAIAYFLLSRTQSHTAAELGAVVTFFLVRWAEGSRLRARLQRRSALSWPAA
jgi:hypothetical protein